MTNDQNQMNEIINKVANSGLVTIDPEEFISEGERFLFDIKPLLFQELILKEKDFREFIKTHDWKQYKNKYIALTCSTDSVIPNWAYMLLTLALQPFAKKIVFGTLTDLENLLFAENISKLNIALYKDARVVIKGCGEKYIPVNAYVQLTELLKPVVKSILFGEPCSTVPLYKSK